MKKMVCLVLALLMCVSAVALAESVPSKTVFALTHFEVTAENQVGDENVFLLPVNESTVGEALPNYQEYIDVCELEIQKMADSEDVVSYFGEVTDAEGNVVDMRELLGVEADEPLDVFEFCPAIAGGFQEDCGKVTATLLFSTPYEKDEKVLVLIGIVNQPDEAAQTDEAVQTDETADAAPTAENTEDQTVALDGEEQTVTWQVFEGVGMDMVEDQDETYGSIQVELTQEIVQSIQNEMALMAVVSKPDTTEEVTTEDTVTE